MGILLGSSLPHVWARRSWSRDEIEKLIELGIFGPEEKLELVDGVLIPKVTRTPLHATGICMAQNTMLALGFEHVQVRVQLPLRLGPNDRPEPDVALVQGGLRDFKVKHPRTAMLIVEVSQTTLPFDRTTKASMYARAEIQDYWIVNIDENLLEVHREPVDDPHAILCASYSQVQKLSPGQAIAPLCAPEHQIAVSDLLI